MIVNLEQQEWSQLLAILAQAPWNVANPLIMKVGEQLRLQTPGQGASVGRANGSGEGMEASDPPESRQRAS